MPFNKKKKKKLLAFNHQPQKEKKNQRRRSYITLMGITKVVYYMDPLMSKNLLQNFLTSLLLSTSTTFRVQSGPLWSLGFTVPLIWILNTSVSWHHKENHLAAKARSRKSLLTSRRNSKLLPILWSRRPSTTTTTKPRLLTKTHK